MSVVQQFKEALGIQSYEYRYTCHECGETFESNQEPDSHWLACRECGSEDVELEEEQ